MFGFNVEPTWSVPASFMSDIVPVCGSSPFNVAVVPPTSEIKKKEIPTKLFEDLWLAVEAQAFFYRTHWSVDWTHLFFMKWVLGMFMVT